jgi:hypothetical protein
MGFGAAGVALKNCVKLPPADADSVEPGVENPFDRDAGTGDAPGLCDAPPDEPLPLPERIRVNSPAVASGELLCFGGTAGELGLLASPSVADGLPPSVWNICVNSPPPLPGFCVAACEGEMPATPGLPASFSFEADAAPATSFSLAGSSVCLSKARKNIPVALSDSS